MDAQHFVLPDVIHSDCWPKKMLFSSVPIPDGRRMTPFPKRLQL